MPKIHHAILHFRLFILTCILLCASFNLHHLQFHHAMCFLLKLKLDRFYANILRASLHHASCIFASRFVHHCIMLCAPFHHASFHHASCTIASCFVCTIASCFVYHFIMLRAPFHHVKCFVAHGHLQVPLC